METGGFEVAEPERPSSAVRHRYALVAVLALALYVPFLGGWDLWYPDEPDLGEVAVAMYKSGDWVAPRRMGVIWVDYPPLVYWTGVASSHLFGRVSAFSLRLPNALFGVGLVLLTCLAGSRLDGPRAGLWAGVAMATFLQFALQAVGYRPDVPFSFFIAAGLFAYAAGAGERPRWWLRVAGFALLGLAMLAKGPLGLLLPGLVLTLWHGWRRRWRLLVELAPLALVSLAVYLPWFVACAKEMGSQSILHELYAQNVARFFGGERGHAQPPWYYLVNVWVDLWPWGLLLPVALWWAHRRRRWRDRDTQLLAWWLGAFLVFLSIAVTKRQLYLLPAYPAAALLLAPWLARFGAHQEEERPSSRALRGYGWAFSGLSALLGLAGLAAAGPAFERVLERAALPASQLPAAHGLRWPLAVVSGLLLVAAWAYVRQLRRRDHAGLLARFAAAQLLISGAAFALVFPAMNPLKSYRAAAEWVGRQVGEEGTFGLYWPQQNLGFRKMGAFGYFSGKMVEVLYEPSEVEGFFRRHPHSLVVVEERAEGDLAAADPDGWSQRILRDDLYTAEVRYAVVAAPPAPPP
jgi:4-amino-4-deoxy-L-arabinose transferase-like glycosyltransferase